MQRKLTHLVEIVVSKNFRLEDPIFFILCAIGDCGLESVVNALIAYN